MALEFTLGLCIEVRDLYTDPDNEVDNFTRATTVEGVAAQDTEQHMEYSATTHTKHNNPTKLTKVTIKLAVNMAE